jgi:hypothetical protein
VPLFVDELIELDESIQALKSESFEEEVVDEVNNENKGADEEEEDEEDDVDEDDEGEEDDEGDEDEPSFEEELERFDAVKASASAVLSAVTSEGVGFLLSEIGELIENGESISEKRWGCWLLQQFLSGSKSNYEEYLPLILRYLLSRIAETDSTLLSVVSVYYQNFLLQFNHIHTHRVFI